MISETEKNRIKSLSIEDLFSEFDFCDPIPCLYEFDVFCANKLLYVSVKIFSINIAFHNSLNIFRVNKSVLTKINKIITGCFV